MKWLERWRAAWRAWRQDRQEDREPYDWAEIDPALRLPPEGHVGPVAVSRTVTRYPYGPTRLRGRS